MPTEEQQILAFIRSVSDRPMKPKELAKALNIPGPQYQAFRRTLKQLLQDGRLVRLKRGRIGLPDKLNVVTGALTVTRGGTGFVTSESGGDDIMVFERDLLTALDGDRVMVRLTGKRYDRQTGAVIKVVERKKRRIVGLFKRSGPFNYVSPDNPRLHRDLYIADEHVGDARPGDKVVAELLSWTDPHLNPQGKVIERLGRPTDPGVDMLAIIKSYELPEEFPPDVMTEAEQAAAPPIEAEQAKRLDLTGECIYTIDPADAKDHDDAISVARTPRGYRLGVHIADVSWFVRPGGKLDAEAFNRGNSVYLPGMVIPMLPEVLSNDVCSLRPNRRRLAHSMFIEFDQRGKMLTFERADTVIKSRAKLSYEEVQSFFDGGAVSNRIKRVADSLRLARELAGKLSAQRFASGSLDFDLPEAQIILGPNGEVLELGRKIRLEAHRLVEEFMLAANKAVALLIFRTGQPMLYRVHDKPDQEKLEAFAHLVSRLGYRFPVSKTVKPIQFARFLKQIKDAPEADFINELMLRSMQKAVYQRQNIGHFGLAFTHYTHFTSPIRRYPDLLVHRLLRKLRNGRYPPAFAKRIVDVIDNVGKHCSETERIAEAAERQAVRVKQVAYMARHVGDEYDGVISGVVPHGFFVRINDLGAEGMVRVSTIDDDYYQYDEPGYRLVGQRTGKTYRLGDPVRVGVLKVDRVYSEIEFFLPVTAARKVGKKTRPKRGKRTKVK